MTLLIQVPTYDIIYKRDRLRLKERRSKKYLHRLFLLRHCRLRINSHNEGSVLI